eukprot:688935-Pelagomonas_calceolata.AAC.6
MAGAWDAGLTAGGVAEGAALWELTAAVAAASGAVADGAVAGGAAPGGGGRGPGKGRAGEKGVNGGSWSTCICETHFLLALLHVFGAGAQLALSIEAKMIEAFLPEKGVPPGLPLSLQHATRV